MLHNFLMYYKPYKKLFIIDFGCAVLSAALDLMFPLGVNWIIDRRSYKIQTKNQKSRRK